MNIPQVTSSTNFQGRLNIFDCGKKGAEWITDDVKLKKVREIVRKGTHKDYELDICRRKDSNDDYVRIEKGDLTEAVAVVDTDKFVKWFNETPTEEIGDAFIRMTKYGQFQEHVGTKLSDLSGNILDTLQPLEDIKLLLGIIASDSNISKTMKPVALENALSVGKCKLAALREQFTDTQKWGQEVFGKIIDAPSLDFFKKHGQISELPHNVTNKDSIYASNKYDRL